MLAARPWRSSAKAIASLTSIRETQDQFRRIISCPRKWARPLSPHRLKAIRVLIVSSAKSCTGRSKPIDEALDPLYRQLGRQIVSSQSLATYLESAVPDAAIEVDKYQAPQCDPGFRPIKNDDVEFTAPPGGAVAPPPPSPPGPPAAPPPPPPPITPAGYEFGIGPGLRETPP